MPPPWGVPADTFCAPRVAGHLAGSPLVTLAGWITAAVRPQGWAGVRHGGAVLLVCCWSCCSACFSTHRYRPGAGFAFSTRLTSPVRLRSTLPLITVERRNVSAYGRFRPHRGDLGKPAAEGSRRPREAGLSYRQS